MELFQLPFLDTNFLIFVIYFIFVILFQLTCKKDIIEIDIVFSIPL